MLVLMLTKEIYEMLLPEAVKTYEGYNNEGICY